jgi:hypothetical protein
LLPDDAQKADLLATMERFNEAATFAEHQSRGGCQRPRW